MRRVHFILGRAIVAMIAGLFLLGAGPTPSIAVCISSATQESMFFNFLQFDTGRDLNSTELTVIPLAMGQRNWTADSYTQNTSTPLPLGTFATMVTTPGAISIYSHGASGAVAIGYYATQAARNTAYAALLAAHTEWQDNVHVYVSSVSWPGGTMWLIAAKGPFISGLAVRSDAFVVGAFCESYAAAYNWQSMGFVGWEGICGPKFGMHQFWVRMAVATFPAYFPRRDRRATEADCAAETRLARLSGQVGRNGI